MKLLFILLSLLFSLVTESREIKTIEWHGVKTEVAANEFLIELNPPKLGDTRYPTERLRDIFSKTLSTFKDSKRFLSDNLKDKLIVNTKSIQLFHTKLFETIDEKAFISLSFKNPEIKSIQPNFIYHTMEISSGGDVFGRWNLDAMKVPEAHQLINDKNLWNTNVTIAVLDTGIFPHHPAFQNIVDPLSIYTVTFLYNAKMYMTNAEYDKPISGMIMNPETGEPESYMVTGGFHDWMGHGTHCAGMVGGAYIESKNFLGVAPYYRIMPIKVMDDSGNGSTAEILQGVMYAKQHGAHVISMSSGNTADDYIARRLYQEEIIASNIPLVTAAGNSFEQGNPVIYPAAYDYAISVAATGSDDRIAYYSESYPWVSIAAPGGDGKKKNKAGKQRQILSTWTADPRATFGPFNTPLENGEDRKYYAGLSGTSMATPQVAGLVALIRGIKPELTPAQIKTLLQDTGDLVTDSYHPQQIQKMKGIKKVNAYNAIKAITTTGIPFPGTGGGGWGKIFLNVAKGFPANTLFLRQAALAYQGQDLILKPEGATRIDVSNFGATKPALTLPSAIPPGGEKVTIRFSFDSGSYIADKLIYLNQMTDTPFLIYRNYNLPKYSIYLSADSKKNNYVLSVKLD